MKGGGSVTKLPVYIYIYIYIFFFFFLSSRFLSSHSNSLVGGQMYIIFTEKMLIQKKMSCLCLFAMAPKMRTVEDAPVDCLSQLWQEPPLRADR